MNLKKLLIWACAILIALTPFSAFAENNISLTLEGYMALAGDQSMQAWINGGLTDGVGSRSDGYVLALLHIQDAFETKADFSTYRQALLRAIRTDAFDSPVSKQRSALTLIALGAGDAPDASLADETIGKLGIMSYIFGLHLLNNGASSTLWTEETLVDKLLSMQKEDGGWAVNGNWGDVDVTAMCLQALALQAHDDKTEQAVNAAIDFLSQKQLESGGYASYGQENCESCAQVLLALDALGIDSTTDERFIKNGHTALDALLSYRTDDALFEHIVDSGANEMATAQALSALIALDTDGAFYDLTTLAADNSALISEKSAQTLGIRAYLLIALGALTVAGVVFAATRKRSRIKHLIFVLLSAAALFAAVLTIDVQSSKSYYGGEARKLTQIDGYVTLSVRCDTVAGQGDRAVPPESGVIMDDTRFPFQSGDSVFDILTDAVRKGGLQMEYSGTSSAMAYVKSINNLYEYDFGEMSGWMYSVNGEYLSVGCGGALVQDGDIICWQYTTALGEDLK